MNYKDLKGYLIAVDLDNTIVSGFDNIDKESFEILKELSINNYLIIATGRPYRSSKYFYELLNLNTPIINYNGAYVHNPKDAFFEETMLTIDNKKLKKFVRDNSDILINAFCEIRDELYLLKETEEIKPYLHLDGATLHLGDFEDTLKSNSNGAILFAKADSIDKIQSYIQKNFKEVLLRPWKVDDIFVGELYTKEISKGDALEKICKYYNIDKEKTIAFGDGHNDIEMIDFAHISVAMENSHPELIKHAKYKTLSVFDSGLSYFFKNHKF